MSEETRQISKLGRLARNLYDGLRRLPTVPIAYLHPGEESQYKNWVQ